MKEGPGTMSVAGGVNFNGFITVYDGTLDLAKATLSPARTKEMMEKGGRRWNALDGNAAGLIPQGFGTPHAR